MTVETELKLVLAPRVGSRLMTHPVVEALATEAAKEEHLLSVYYDTPKMELWFAKLSVRLRRASGGWLQTVKRGGETVGGLHIREEYETPVPDQALDWDRIDTAAADAVVPVRVRRRIRPVFITEFRRTTRMLRLADGSEIELCLDRGHIVAGTLRQPLCELELELKAGDMSSLFHVASSLMAELPLRPAYHSKAERGYLLAGLPRAPVKAARLQVEDTISVGQLAARIIATGLTQMHANEEGMLAAEDIEYLHQMRVAVRRLRSCVGIFAHVLPAGALDGIRAELKWLGARLGPARDWDVFAVEMLPRLRQGLSNVVPAEQLRDVSQSASSERQRAQKSARLALNSRRTARLLLELARLSAGDGVLRGQESLQAPAISFTSSLLERRMSRMLRRVDRRKPATLEELHALRIAVKKLRYAVEFFGALYDADRVKPFRDRLVKLQDCLGSINDASTMLKQMKVLAGPHTGLVDALAGWNAHSIHGERGRFRALWREFRRTRPFW